MTIHRRVALARSRIGAMGIVCAAGGGERRADFSRGDAAGATIHPHPAGATLAVRERGAQGRAAAARDERPRAAGMAAPARKAWPRRGWTKRPGQCTFRASWEMRAPFRRAADTLHGGSAG